MKQTIHRRLIVRKSYQKWYADPANQAKKVAEASARVRRNRKKNRRRLWVLKSELGCSSCPEHDPRCLDFHHRDPDTKLFCLGDQKILKRADPWKEMTEEIAKCDILCANCHRKLTLASLS